MSKSRGNIVRATPITTVMGIDALRYFLLREVVFGRDGSFSYDALVTRFNADLANGLGNLVSRTLSMIHQYRKGVIPAAACEIPADDIVPRRANFTTLLSSRGRWKRSGHYRAARWLYRCGAAVEAE